MILRSISLACKGLFVVRLCCLRYDVDDVSMAKLMWCKQTNNVRPLIVICHSNVLYVTSQSLVPGTKRRLLSSASLLSRGTLGGCASSEFNCVMSLLDPAMCKSRMLSNSTTRQSMDVYNMYKTHIQHTAYVLNTHCHEN